jgi:hypothetical protein
LTVSPFFTLTLTTFPEIGELKSPSSFFLRFFLPDSSIGFTLKTFPSTKTNFSLFPSVIIDLISFSPTLIFS